jgi:hypothetical protein
MGEDEGEGEIPLPPLHSKTSTPSSKFVFCETGFGAASLGSAISIQIQSGSKTKRSIKVRAMDMWPVLYWTGPIGVGIFLVCLGGMVYLWTKADDIKKRTKAFAQEKGLEKK